MNDEKVRQSQDLKHQKNERKEKDSTQKGANDLSQYVDV